MRRSFTLTPSASWLAVGLVLLLVVVSATAQTRSFRWRDELCTYSGTYDAGKHTLAQLNNTLKLIRPGSYNLETNTTVWKYSDIARLNVAALDAEFKRKSAELRSMPIVRSPYFEDLRSRMLREMEQVYRLERTTMRAYRDRGVLLEYTAAPVCTTRFANPLIAGGDELLDIWLIVNEEARTKNSDPARLKRIYEQQLRSPDRLNYALIEVMSFGWYNCANALIDRVDFDGTPEAEFKKLFMRVRNIRCDEP